MTRLSAWAWSPSTPADVGTSPCVASRASTSAVNDAVAPSADAKRSTVSMTSTGPLDVGKSTVRAYDTVAAAARPLCARRCATAASPCATTDASCSEGGVCTMKPGDTSWSMVSRYVFGGALYLGAAAAGPHAASSDTATARVGMRPAMARVCG